MKEVKVFARELVSAIRGRIKTRVMNPDGVVMEHPWQRNLILDSGLDKVAYMPWASTFQWCVSGTGTTPTKVDDGVSTASQSSSTVTITGGTFMFTPSHVGKLIYWGVPNIEARISGFIDSQHAQVSVSQTVGSNLFVIYNVDQTTLVTPYSQNMRYQTGSGYCGTTFTGNTIKLLRTFDFYMELSPVLITEIGFKEAPAATLLFSRILLVEPLYLSPGQWLQVSYELTLRLEPQTLAPKTPTITGWPLGSASDTSGNEQIQLFGIAQVDTQGITNPVDFGLLANEPYAPGTRLLGPGYGYVNRWQNGAGSPIKIYTAFAANPFINPREMAAKYLASSSKNYVPAGATGNVQWYNATYPILDNSRLDCMQPLLPPPLYPSMAPPDTAAWNGVDPYSNFPNATPFYGQTAWANWKAEVSPDTVTPSSITLTASGTNIPGAAYQWQKFNGATFDNIVGANGTAYQVLGSDVVPNTPVRYRVVINSDGTTPGRSGETIVYANDDLSSPSDYVVALSNTAPNVHWQGTSGFGQMILDAADVGVNGRAATLPSVLRNIVPLVHTANNPATGQFRVILQTPLTNYLTVDPTTGKIYFPSVNSSPNPTASVTGTVLISCEGKFTAVISLTYSFFTDHIDYVTLTPSANLFAKGTGLLDVGGSSVFISENGSVPAAVGSAIDRSIPRNVEIPLVLEPYVPKAFTRVKKATFLTNMANGSNWRTIGIGGTDADITVANRVNAAKFNSYAFVFNQAQTKLNTHELSVFFRYTWRRDFS